MDYVSLKKEVIRLGLLNRTPYYYLFNILIFVILFGLVYSLTFYFNNNFVIIFGAILLGFFAVQAGLIAHDTGHKEITNSNKLNNLLGHGLMTMITGINFSYWNDRHNRHHANPNHEQMDPDVFEQAMTFTKNQLLKRRKLAKFVAKHQAVLFLPIYLFTSFGLRLEGIKHIKRAKTGILDYVFLTLHVLLWFVLPLFFFTLLQTLLFYFISSLAIGIYFTLIFVPNHWGMPIIEGDKKRDFLEQQVITSRNIKSNFIVNYLMGGLNYQIEHHLFPTVSRKNLKKVNEVVKRYCMKMKIKYQEQSYFSALKDIFAFLHKVSKESRLVLIN